MVGATGRWFGRRIGRRTAGSRPPGPAGRCRRDGRRWDRSSGRTSAGRGRERSSAREPAGRRRSTRTVVVGIVGDAPTATDTPRRAARVWRRRCRAWRSRSRRASRATRLVLADRESVATARVGDPIHPQRLDGGTGVVPHHRHHRDVAAVHRQESLDVGAGTLVLHLGRREVGVGVAAVVVPGPRDVLVGARGQCLVRSDVVAIARFELTDRGEDHVDVLGEHDPLTGRGAARLECRAARKARQDEPRHALARPARVDRGQRCARFVDAPPRGRCSTAPRRCGSAGWSASPPRRLVVVVSVAGPCRAWPQGPRLTAVGTGTVSTGGPAPRSAGGATVVGAARCRSWSWASCPVGTGTVVVVVVSHGSVGRTSPVRSGRQCGPIARRWPVGRVVVRGRRRGGRRRGRRRLGRRRRRTRAARGGRHGGRRTGHAVGRGRPHASRSGVASVGTAPSARCIDGLRGLRRRARRRPLRTWLRSPGHYV